MINIHNQHLTHSLTFTFNFTEEDVHQCIVQTEEELRNLIYQIMIQRLEYLVSLIKQSFDQNDLLKNDTDSTLSSVTEERHLDRCDNPIKDIYDKLKHSILSISPNIAVKSNKYYIAFINKRNFIYLKTKRSKLQLNLNLKKGELNDPKNIAIDISNSQIHTPF